MRAFKVVLVTAMVSFSFFVVSAYGADVAKIGVINFQKILETSNAGKEAMAEISKQGKKMEVDLNSKGLEIEEVKKKLEREALVMSKEMREEKEREIRIKINDIKTLRKRYESNLRDVQKRLVNRIRKELLELVKDVGKKGGYLLIIENIGVLYSPKTIDITDEIIQKYNVSFDKKTKVEKKE
jgi:outer membrane protein